MCLFQVAEQTTGGIKFGIVNDGIDSHHHFHPIGMCIAAKITDISHGIACGSPGTKLLSTDIYSIGTMVDSSYGTLQIAGWRK